MSIVYDCKWKGGRCLGLKLTSYPVYWATMAFAGFCRMLPESGAASLGRLIGSGVWHFLPEHRKRRARVSLREYFGANEEETERILRASLERYGPMGVEGLRIPLIAKDVERYIGYKADAESEKAFASGKGGILVTLHSGNWELFGLGMAHYVSAPFATLVRRQQFDAWDKLARQIRTVRVIYPDETRKLYRSVREGYFVNFLMDQGIHDAKDAVPAEFLGHTTGWTPAPATIARFFGVPVLPMFIHQEPGGRHIIEVKAPIQVPKTDDKDADLEEATQAIVRVFEAHIRKYPEDWNWLYSKWRDVVPEKKGGVSANP